MDEAGLALTGNQHPAVVPSRAEVAVQQALGEALGERTALVIAHCLRTIRAAGEILMIEAGKIVERGTHGSLLAKNGRYAELYRTWFAKDGDQSA